MSWPRSWPTPATHVTAQRRAADVEQQRAALVDQARRLTAALTGPAYGGAA